MEEFLIETYRILKHTDATEYSSLSVTQKAIYGLIVSAGKVDFADNSNVKDLLWNMFDENTITGAAFRNTSSGLIVPPPVEES